MVDTLERLVKSCGGDDRPDCPILDDPREECAMNKDFQCPMHPEERSCHASECPQCGMTLERDPDAPEPAPKAASKARPGQYTCPMCPEVVSDVPDSCPKLRHGAREGVRAGRGDEIHLPDAPGRRQRRAGRLPDLRHGARAGDRRCRRGGRRPRTGQHDPALLVFTGTEPAVAHHRHGRHDSGESGQRARSGRYPAVGRTHAGDARCPVRPPGRSSSVAGVRSSTGTSTCSR